MPPTRTLAAIAATAFATLALPSAAGAASLPKAWQAKHHVRSAASDPDHDGLRNWTEYRAHTDPRRADSDHDGRRDGREDYDGDGLRNLDEQRTGNDPGDSDTDNDGTRDGGEDAGRIVSFEGGVLTIAVGGGRTVSGTVDETTALECPTADDLESAEDDDAAASRNAQDDEELTIDETACTEDALVAGGYVHDAVLVVDGGDTFFESVVLVGED